MASDQASARRWPSAMLAVERKEITSGIDVFFNEPGSRDADYIKKKMESQIEQFNKREKTTTQHQATHQ